MPAPAATAPLAAAFAGLRRERAATWSAASLAANAAQRRALVEAFDPAAAVRVGDVLPDVGLIDAGGGTIRLGELVADGPAVLIFFRHADCPADNLALPLYESHLLGALAAAGVPLVALSPQLPERLAVLRQRHGLRMTIASDPDNRLTRALGITFVPPETPAPPPAGWIGEITGTGTWELPQTAVLIVDGDRIARFVAIDPDWLDRVEPAVVLDAFAALAKPAAAREAAA